MRGRKGNIYETTLVTGLITSSKKKKNLTSHEIDYFEIVKGCVWEAFRIT